MIFIVFVVFGVELGLGFGCVSPAKALSMSIVYLYQIFAIFLYPISLKCKPSHEISVFLSNCLLTVFALLTVGICGSFLPLPKASAAALIYDDFETGLNGWGPRGPETVELTTEEAYSGRYSLKVSGRTSTWNGPMVDKTDVLTLGESYKLSVYVKFVGDSYSNEQRFSCSFNITTEQEMYTKI